MGVFGLGLKIKIITLFSLFLLLFMGPTALFDTIQTMCVFGLGLKIKIIALFSLFLLLFIGSTALFGTIHRSYCTISINFYLYLQYFQQ